MPSNPYSPPTAEVKDPPPAPGSPVKALLIGVGVDIGGTVLAGIVIGIVYSVILTNSGASPEEIGAVLQAFSPTSLVGMISIAVGCAFSVLGGFVCARVAHSTNYKLGGVLAAISISIGLLLSGEQTSWAFTFSMAALTAGCVLLGTRLGLRRDDFPATITP